MKHEPPGASALYRDPRYYDHAYRRYRPDVSFYVREARRSHGPVLELGVGTGRIALALADADVEVVGIDRSATMLARAVERIAKKPRRIGEKIDLREGDLRTIRLRRRFPLVIAPFNVLQHLYEDEDMTNALAVVRRHLAPGGRFAFDVLVPDPSGLTRDPDHFYKCRPTVHPRDGRRYEYAESFHYDHARQIQTVTMRFTDPEDRDRVFFSQLTQRQIFPRELGLLMHCHGFEVISHDGGFDGESLDERSESQVVVARAR